MKKPSKMQAVICLSVTLLILLGGLFFIHAEMHGLVIIAVAWVILNAFWVDKDVHRIKQCVHHALQKAAPVLLIYLLIGTIMGAFIVSGTIPALIYYGIKWIHPSFFLPVGLLLCSVVSLAIGSCWATIGTLGVALMGMASLLHLSLPMTAGMIISGAYFGDKLSPLSDTTILSAMVTETDLYKHIHGMTYSLIPAYVLCIGLFSMLNAYAMPKQGVSVTQMHLILEYLSTHYHIGLLTLLPLAVMFMLTILKKPAELAMLVGIVLALSIAVGIQGYSLQMSLNALYHGLTLNIPHHAVLQTILNQGGMEKMLSSLSLTVLVLTLGGLFESYQWMTVVFTSLLKKLKTAVSLVIATMITSVISNLLVSEAYLSIILVHKLFKDPFKVHQLDTCLLSKSIEEGTTFSTPLIPWTTSGVFIAQTLGMSPTVYLPWCLLNLIAPLCFILFVACGCLGRSMYFTQKAESL